MSPKITKVGKRVLRIGVVLLCIVLINKWSSLKTHLRLEDSTVIKQLCVSDFVLFQYEKPTWLTAYLEGHPYNSDRVLYIDEMRLYSFTTARSNRVYYLMNIQKLEGDLMVGNLDSGREFEDLDSGLVIAAATQLLQEIEADYDK